MGVRMRAWIFPVLLLLAVSLGGVAAPLSIGPAVPNIVDGLPFQEVKVRLVLLQATVTTPRGKKARSEKSSPSSRR